MPVSYWLTCQWVNDSQHKWNLLYDPIHDDDLIDFLPCWNLGMGIYQSSMHSPHKGLGYAKLWCFFVVSLKSCWTNILVGSNFMCHNHNINAYLHLVSFHTLKLHMHRKPFLMDNNDITVLCGKYHTCWWPGCAKCHGAFQKHLNPRSPKFSPAIKIYIFQCMDKIFSVEFQWYPLKFHTKYHTHTLKDTFLYNNEILRTLRFKSSYVFLKRPP